ncbi:MAG TPA: ABC transporter ATP-binding protein [Solirubrobacteraceae bacterium]|nr:ABC transporter ATP-binding protein [Solirubrobacteraceae bacterium]
MSQTGALEVADLWKGYSSTEVLRSVDLDVAPGSLSAVLGLSGCGKTTLLRVIAGFERAQRGRVALSGQVLDDGRNYIAPERRGIGYVPQEGALFPHLDVRANVGFGLSRAERRGATVGELLEMVGLSALARRMPHELSGGEQQRAALARALARRPALLLLDEPFSSLDATLRGAVREEVSALLRRQGTTTVLVTHDQEEALSLADSVAVLRDGTIIQQGSPADIYGAPTDARLAGFLGEANLMEAVLENGQARTSLGTLELRGGASRAPSSVQGIVVVRPEQLRVRAGTDGGEGLRGRVEQCRYYGHDALLSIHPEDSPLASPLLARVHGEEALAVGTDVVVTATGTVSAVDGGASR